MAYDPYRPAPRRRERRLPGRVVFALVLTAILTIAMLIVFLVELRAHHDRDIRDIFREEHERQQRFHVD